MIFLWFVLLVLLPCANAANVTVNMCFLFRNTSSGQAVVAYHAMYAHKLESSRYPEIDFTLRPINIGSTSRAMLKRVLAPDVAACDVFLGVGTSRFAVALGAILYIPHVDYAATSLELGDKTVHPLFARVVPTDAVTGKAMAPLFQWRLVNALCGPPHKHSAPSTFLSSYRGACPMV